MDPCRITVRCDDLLSNLATVTVNDQHLPLTGLMLEFRSDELVRATLEVEPDSVDVVTDALPGVLVVEPDAGDSPDGPPD